MRILALVLFSASAFAQTTVVNGWGTGASLPKTTSILKGDGSGGALSATVGTDYAAANATTTVNGQTCALGGSCTVSSTGSIATKTANYTITSSDGTVQCNANGGAFSLTLPASPTTGETHPLKKVDSSSNKCTIAGNGQTIESFPSNAYLVAKNQTATVQYDGTQWRVIAGSLNNGYFYPYYRLNITSEVSAGNCSMAELRLFDNNGLPVGTNGVTVTASSTNGSFVAANALDWANSTFWDSSGPASSGSPITFQLFFAQYVSVASLSITSRPDSFFNETPVNFTFQGSTDGSSWTTLGTFTAATWTASSQVQTFTLP